MEQAVLCHANHLFSGAYLQVSKLQTDRVRAESWKQPWQQLALLGSRLLMPLIPCQLNTSRFLIRKKNTNINPPPPAVLKTISTNAVPLGSLLCPHFLLQSELRCSRNCQCFPGKMCHQAGCTLLKHLCSSQDCGLEHRGIYFVSVAPCQPLMSFVE